MIRFSEKWEQASMTGQPSPSPPSQSCGRTVVAPQETGYQNQGALKGTGWWTSCAGQSVVVQPSERWTGTGAGERNTSVKYCFTTLITSFVSEQNP